MSKTRLEAFSDGVIAILITIMVLDSAHPARHHLGPAARGSAGAAGLRAQFRPHRHLLEQPPPHARGGYPDLWHDAVGPPAPAVLAVAHPRRHGLDEREPLPADPRSRLPRRAACRLPCLLPTPRHTAAHRRRPPRPGLPH